VIQFQVRLFDPQHATVREEAAEAESREALLARFAAAGVTVLSVQSAERTAIVRLRGAAGGGGLDVGWWCRELRTLLSAGMTVVEALDTLHAQQLGRARGEVHAALIVYLRQGHSLSAAMRQTNAFPAVLIAGVKASERSSALGQALDEYIQYHEMLERLRKQVVSAAIYPAVVIAIGGAITLLLLLFVIPRFSRMYRDLHGPVSWTTQVLVAISHTLNVYGSVVVVGLALVIVALVASWRSGLAARLVATLGERIAPLQREIDEFRLAKLYHSLALMFRGGYALDDALAQCAALGLGERMREGVQAAQHALARGQRVSAAFADAGLTDSVTQRLLSVGERTGNFDQVLQTIAERHATTFNTFIERATRIVEPVLLLTVALVVGGIVVMMYMPVYDIAGSVR
jgi:general secretion pathway protein F